MALQLVPNPAGDAPNTLRDSIQIGIMTIR
jgi:hypothetical protein